MQKWSRSRSRYCPRLPPALLLPGQRGGLFGAGLAGRLCLLLFIIVIGVLFVFVVIVVIVVGIGRGKLFHVIPKAHFCFSSCISRRFVQSQRDPFVTQATMQLAGLEQRFLAFADEDDIEEGRMVCPTRASPSSTTSSTRPRVFPASAVMCRGPIWAMPCVMCSIQRRYRNDQCI